MTITDAALAKLVAHVKAHAQAHYTDGGWDVIVECWEDDQIAKVLREDDANTPAKAIASFKPVVDVWADRQADARNSRF